MARSKIIHLDVALTVEEAIEALENVGHSFYIFKNKARAGLGLCFPFQILLNDMLVTAGIAGQLLHLQHQGARLDLCLCSMPIRLVVTAKAFMPSTEQGARAGLGLCLAFQ